MRSRLLALTLALALCVAPMSAGAATSTPAPIAAAPTGTAQTAPSATAAAPVVTPVEMQVQMWPSEPGGAVLLVSAELATDAALPATVRMPVPAGAQIVWSGEIAPTGGAAQDIQRPYTTEDGTGGTVLVMTLTTYRSAQFEAQWPASKPIGGKLVSTLDWVQSAPAKQVIFAAKMSPQAGSVSLDPAPSGAPQRNELGEYLFSLAPRTLAPGEAFTLAVAYTLGGGAATGSPAAGGGSGLLTVLLVALALAVIAFVVVLVRSRRAAAEVPATSTPRRSGVRSEPASRDPRPAGSDDDPFDVDFE